jgi:hypothetical protein
MDYLSSRDFGTRDLERGFWPVHPGLDDLAFHTAVAVGI